MKLAGTKTGQMTTPPASPSRSSQRRATAFEGRRDSELLTQLASHSDELLSGRSGSRSRLGGSDALEAVANVLDLSSRE